MRIKQMGFSSRLVAHRHLLTLETLRFLVEYLGDENRDPKGAAIRAGIPEKYAYRQGRWLLKLPMVKRVLESDINERDVKKLQVAMGQIEEQMRMCKEILGLEESY